MVRRAGCDTIPAKRNIAFPTSAFARTVHESKRSLYDFEPYGRRNIFAREMKFSLTKNVQQTKVTFSVGTATGYGLESRSSIPGWGKEHISTPKRPDRLCWSPPSPLSSGYGGFFPRR
jgi:hypothetical protein